MELTKVWSSKKSELPLLLHCIHKNGNAYYPSQFDCVCLFLSFVCGCLFVVLLKPFSQLFLLLSLSNQRRYQIYSCFIDLTQLFTIAISNKLGLPSGKCQRGEFVYLLWNVPIQIFFHNFRGLKWIPLQKRMAPNFKTTTLAHSRLSLLLNNNNMA